MIYRTRIKKRSRQGFSLIELSFSLILISILAMILFPVFARARERARATSCIANLSSIGMALQLYAEDWNGMMPPQDDNLAPIARRMKYSYVFDCPSNPSGISRRIDKLIQDTPDEEKELILSDIEREKALQQDGNRRRKYFTDNSVIIKNKLVGQGYYYRSGLSNESAGDEFIVTENQPNHSDGANVLYVGGNIEWLPEEKWRQLMPAEILEEEWY